MMIFYSLQMIVFAIASLLHGLTGMGFPMIGTIALSMMMPLPKAIAIMAFPSLLMSVLVLVLNNQRHFLQEMSFYFKKYWLLAITSLLGSVVGVKLLLIVPAGVVYLLMAVVTLYYVVDGYLSNQGMIKGLTFPTGNISMALFGLLAGIIGGATNAMSPILMMFLFSYTQDKHEIAKASNICYLLGKLVQIFLLKEQVLAFNHNEVTILIVLTIVSMICLYIGIRLRVFISHQLFKNVIYLILLLLSIKVGYSGIHFFI